MKTKEKLSKRPLITINPREQLTNKAKKGISAYAWLDEHGYRWNGVYWRKDGDQ